MNRFLRILILAAALVCVLTSGKPVEQAFTVQGHQGNICALLHKPDGFRKGRSYPVVLIFHGFTGNKNEDMLIMLSEKLGQEGIASVRFDFNAHGESDGEFSGMTVANELQGAHTSSSCNRPTSMRKAASSRERHASSTATSTRPYRLSQRSNIMRHSPIRSSMFWTASPTVSERTILMLLDLRWISS